MTNSYDGYMPHGKQKQHYLPGRHGPKQGLALSTRVHVGSINLGKLWSKIGEFRAGIYILLNIHPGGWMLVGEIIPSRVDATRVHRQYQPR